MRIQEVVKKTGLQKRTIYYYIEKKLIAPATEKHNGYHDFSCEDVRRLTIIRKLRDAGLPIADIRSILNNPRTTAFYLHKKLNQLQTNILMMEETMKSLDTLAGQLPTCNSLPQLSAQLSKVDFKPDINKRQNSHESRDARLIARYLWQVYIDAPMTEYRQFLWQKLMQYTLEHTRTDLRIMAQYLLYLPPETLDAAGISQCQRNQRVIALTPKDYPAYARQLKQSLIHFCNNAVLTRQWRLLYDPMIHPTTVFAYSASHWLMEFHPDYRRFYDNIHACCMILKDYINSKEGQSFRELLENAFGTHYDFESSSYGDLEIAASFENSVYAQLSPEKIQKFLDTCGK